jgi:hypothetical protein
MASTVHFKVDPRLTSLLGENYRSTETAIKELIDNAWDAEATEVKVYLPAVMSDQPIIVADNGSGMKSEEVRLEYLNIANPRYSRKGERTPNKQRIVKGRKGVGKFAGLILATEMELATEAHGMRTEVKISKKLLLEAAADLEQVPLPFAVEECASDAHGTVITLRNLNQNLAFPKADKLRELLAYDYGKESDFVVYVNNERVFRHDIQGTAFSKAIVLPNGHTAQIKYTIADKPVPASRAGIILRSGGKTIGKPHHFGLEHDEELSDRLRRRIVGEVEVPAEALELTAAGGDVIESDKGFEKLTEEIQSDVKQNLSSTHTKEVNLAKGRLVQQMNRRLESVPGHRRGIIEDRLQRLIYRSYQEGEKEERIGVLVELVLDAMEMDEYWTVCREINEAEKVDVLHFADALDKFGLCDLAFVGQQAKRRLDYLDFLARLANDVRTTEKQMHSALQHSLWVLGNEFSLMASNRQLQSIIEDYVGEKYREKDAADRPDLLLGSNILGQSVLIEFKRPKLSVGREAEAQAKGYADVITRKLGISLQILVIGGEVDAGLVSEYNGSKTRFLSYRAVVANARTNLDWLLAQLGTSTQV